MAPKSNGFMVFTKDWKKKYGKFMSIQQATEEAGKIWKGMDSAARAPYNERAKTETFGRNPKADIKYTCTGRTLTEVEQEKREAENAERQMKRFIETTVRSSMKDGTLITKKYYFIMVNYFVKTLQGNFYVPAEISLSEFSIKHGVTRTYHTMINPGSEIFGHYYEAQSHSDATHKLPLPPKAMGTKELGKIFNDVLEFIYDADTRTYGPIYTHKAAIPIVDSVLTFLKADPVSKDADFRIYSIQYLLFILKDAASEISEEEKVDSYHIIDTYFENDFFEYQAGISCEFHEENDKTKYCTQSCVTRWGYMFCDMLCKHLAVDLVPGRHCPIQTNLNAIIFEPTANDSRYRNFDEDKKKHSGFKTESEASFYPDKSSAMGSYYPDGTHRRNRTSQNRDESGFGHDRHGRRDNRRHSDRKMNDSDSISSSSSGAMRHIKKENERFKQPITPKKEVFDDPDSSDDDLRSSGNPWAQRNRHAPKKPDESYFEIDVAGGYSKTDDNSSIRSYGRGRRFNENDFPSLGRGRGYRPS